ncbi:MAG: hypothetical protein ACTH58_12220 [Marinomonas foliarum]|uniref:Uncharacterized protein n=1 Tax=Marinomonas foliarum TaxID=491950 RepID=A0A368ZW73_9GAMM|nr:hypothetical protein [Marinomonas foliarum]QRV23797.1 hypothetical protein JSY38_17565 [Marinomonas foliarum]RCX01260.1 hypothetical protein DFP77_11734 [Marinomonas foliarum]
MDSQEQYEALLAKWGYADTSVEDHARRQRRARRVKAVVAFFKNAVTAIKKVSSRPQQLGQASN